MYSGIWSLQLALDLGRRVRLLAGLVVPDDPARGERIEVDAVDLPGEQERVEVEAALELGRRALRAERDLEPARDERQLATRPRRGRAPPGRARASGAARCAGGRSARAASRRRLRSPRRGTRAGTRAPRRAVPAGTCSAPSRFGRPGEELEERLVRDRAAHARVDLGVHRLRVEHPLDEPDRRAARERLQLGDAEHRARARATRAPPGR